ncbi:MAG: M3 family oligoendopeptidase [Acidobacteria bacterium]|nr:M3 family oligoendopeptidase [Acidobacteriota bacterium]
MLTLLADPVLCQDDFVAIPKESAAQYHFDFQKNFYANPQAEKVERASYYAVLKRLESLKGKVAASPANLLSALSLYDEVLIEFIRHDTYLYLRYAVNTDDEMSEAESSAMDAEFTRRTAFLQQELIQVKPQTLESFIKRKPALKVYRFAVESAARNRSHTLSLKEEETLSITSPLTSEWQYDLYQKLLRRPVFEKIKTKSGEFDVRRDRLAIANYPDRDVREAGFKKLYAGYASQRDLYAFALINLVAARNRLAELHHFEDAPAEIYFKSYWTKTDVVNILREIEKFSDVYKRYQRLRADYAKKRFGYSEVNVWDVSASANADEVPRFNIEQASRFIREALSPLGAEYGDELMSLLDPANGRMDIVPDKKRRGGGFSKGFPGVTTVFFSGGFAGSYNDVRVLAHESTHAVHRQLMKNNRVLPAYAEGPHYLFESFAIFNELLLPEYLYNHESDAARRRYFLEQFFEGKGMTLFSVAQEETLEQAIYGGVKEGKIKTADDLDALTEQIASRYSIWADKHHELKMQWITSTLFYEDPLYDINYVYGALLALKFYEMYSRNPKEFVPRYIALMKNGFDAPPDVLLKRFLEIDLRDPNLVKDAVRLLENKINSLEVEYSK